MLCALIRIASSKRSNEYNQHTIILQKSKKTSPFAWPGDIINSPWLRGSNHQCLELSKVPKMFEPLKLDCVNKALIHYEKYAYD